MLADTLRAAFPTARVRPVDLTAAGNLLDAADRVTAIRVFGPAYAWADRAEVAVLELDGAEALVGVAGGEARARCSGPRRQRDLLVAGADLPAALRAVLSTVL